MNILVDLFVTFLKIGTFAVGLIASAAVMVSYGSFIDNKRGCLKIKGQ